MGYEVTKMGRDEKNNLSSEEEQNILCEHTPTFSILGFALLGTHPLFIFRPECYNPHLLIPFAIFISSFLEIKTQTSGLAILLLQTFYYPAAVLTYLISFM